MEEYTISVTELLENYNEDYYKLLDLLDSNEKWILFGADKCYCKNIKEFCDIIGLNYNKFVDMSNMYNIFNKKEHHIPLYFLSDDKKMIFRVSQVTFDKDGPGCYFHYFGATSEFNKGLAVHNYMIDNCMYDEVEWGARSFI